jgi:acyl-CoA synthetase (AMP-forming)/AMP-acid ligase II
MEAAVIGVPDEHSGEVPKIFIVKKDPNLTEAQVMDFLKENLTGYKRPKYVEFRRRPAEDPGGQDPAPRTAAEVSFKSSAAVHSGGGLFCFLKENPTHAFRIFAPPPACCWQPPPMP